MSFRILIVFIKLSKKLQNLTKKSKSSKNVKIEKSEKNNLYRMIDKILNNLELNKNLIDDFNKNGFLILDKFIDLKYLDKLRDRFEPLFRGDFETGIEPDEWN